MDNELNIKNPSSYYNAYHYFTNNIYNLTVLTSLTLDEFLTSYKELSKSKSYIIRLNKYFFHILIKIPIVKNIFIKIFGSLCIDNSKIQKNFNINFLSTNQCIGNLVGKI